MGGVVWDVKARGGAYDGWTGETEDAPAEVLILWRCSLPCAGHATFMAGHPSIVLRTAESYRRVELDESRHLAVYEQGDGPSGPTVEEDERELVGAGLGFDWGLGYEGDRFTGGHP